MPRVLTFLFADIEGSTGLLRRLGDERYGALLADYRAVAADAVAAAGGVVEGIEGDGLFARFDLPSAGILAALAMERAFGSRHWDGSRPRVRMAVHTGEADQQGTSWVGLAVHEAARLAEAANGGQILVSGVAAALAEGHLPDDAWLQDLGLYRLRDVPAAVRIHRLRHPDLPADDRPLRALPASRSNLPAPVSSFVGRQRELDEVGELVARHRLVTITGAAGVGKTRVAIEVARRLVASGLDAIWLVDLAPLRVGEDRRDDGVAAAVLAAIGQRPEPGDDLLVCVADALIDDDALLLLDNAEHVLGSTARAVEYLLATCPTLRIVTTSRERLGVPGEATWRLPPLSLPGVDADEAASAASDAVRLFLERAGAVSPGTPITGAELAAAAEICRRLDGIPLAIELAAARTRALPPTAIAGRLDDVFRLLSGGARTALPRQQTLRAAIDWSHTLLTPVERSVFRRLAAFAGSFGLDAAEYVASADTGGAGGTSDPLGPDDVLVALFGLVDKSMVVAEPVDGDVRYRLLEPIRLFAAEELVRAGEAVEVRGRHLDWFRRLAREAAPAVRDADLGWLARLDVERLNHEAALAWAIETDRERAQELAVDLHWYWSRRGRMADGQRWLAKLLPEPDDPPTVLRVEVLLAYCEFIGIDAAPALGCELAERAAAMARLLDDRRLGAWSLSTLMNMRRYVGDARAWDTGLEALAAAEAAGDDREVVFVLVGLSREGLFGRGGDPTPYLERLRRTVPTLEHPVERTLARLLLAEAAVAEGHLDEATAIYREALAAWRTLDDAFSASAVATVLGSLYLRRGDLGAARRSLREAYAVARRTGSPGPRLAVLRAAAGLALAEGDPALAARLIGAAEAAGRKPVRGTLRERLTDELVERLQIALPEGQYDREVAAGWHLKVEDAARLVGLA